MPTAFARGLCVLAVAGSLAGVATAADAPALKSGLPVGATVGASVEP